MFFSLRYTVGESDTRDAPPCGCLPLSLFDLIAVPLSLLLHFIPLCGALVVLVLALSCYLGCLAPLIYVYGCLSCPTHIICGCPGLFCFCSLVFPVVKSPMCVCVCLCVFFPFILDIKFVGRTRRGHTGGRSHRISRPPSFCGACLNACLIARRIQPFLSLVDREVEFRVLTN